MAADVVPNGIKIEWNAVQNGVPIVNRVYVTMSAPPSADDLDDAVVAALAFFNAAKTTYHPSYTLQNITATDVSVANGTQVVFPLTTDNVGTGGSVAAAGNAAVVASFRTQFIGRSFRGRFYFGAMAQENLLNAQNITVETAAYYADLITDFIDALNAINMTLVVVSKFANGVARLVAVATEVISVIVDTKLDSQRRRTAN